MEVLIAYFEGETTMVPRNAKWVYVPNLEEAGRKVMDCIEQNGLGNRDWFGGIVRNEEMIPTHVIQYTGRIVLAEEDATFIKNAGKMLELGKEYFAISYWGDPYRRGNHEHFIIGPCETSASARKAAKNKLQKGQPRNFTDWVEGTIKVVTKDKLEDALAKMKLRMPQSIKDNDYDCEGLTLWRPSEL